MHTKYCCLLRSAAYSASSGSASGRPAPQLQSINSRSLFQQRPAPVTLPTRSASLYHSCQFARSQLGAS